MQDRIKQMAEEAGIDIDADTLCRFETWREPMIRFAQLVAEDCATLFNPCSQAQQPYLIVFRYSAGISSLTIGCGYSRRSLITSIQSSASVDGSME